MHQRDMFKFGDILSSDYDVYTLWADVNNGAERDVSLIEIPGRNGDIHIDNGKYKNIDVIYYCAIVDGADISLDMFNACLLSQVGYKRLEDSIHPEYYREAIFAGAVEPRMSRDRRLSTFELRFNCKPQKYLKSGEISVAISGSGNKLINPTLYDAKPRIAISGTGTGTITINSSSITISQNQGNFVIDCDLEDAYSSATGSNYNSYITLSDNQFPVLHAGENTIGVTNNMSISIIPRWWTV